MKKYLLLLICIFTFAWTSAEVSDHRHGHHRLPYHAYTFITHNFPYSRIVDVDRDDGRYKVELTGGIDISFNRSGRWYKMRSVRYGVPYGLLPSYVKYRICERYGRPVRIIQVRRRGDDRYDVRLSNGREMKIRCGERVPHSNRPHHRPHRYWD